MNRRSLLLVCTLASLSISTAAAEENDDVRRATAIASSGRAEFRKGRFADALGSFEAAYKLLPSAPYLFDQAACLEALHEFPLAAEKLERYLEALPDVAERRHEREAIVLRLSALKNPSAESDRGLTIPTLWEESPSFLGRARRGPGVRFGVGAGPALSLFGGNLMAFNTKVGGGAQVAARFGYQFNDLVGVFVEPTVTLTSDGSFTPLSVAGSLLVQFNVGKYFYVAVGPSIGGMGLYGNGANALCVTGACSVDTWSSVGYGFTARVGSSFFTRSNVRGVSAASLALDVRVLFGEQLAGTDSTGDDAIYDLIGASTSFALTFNFDGY